MISATQIYDYVQCPHRVDLDLFGNLALRDEPNAFVELLWEQGVTHENTLASLLPITTNLKDFPLADREQGTLAAMQRRDPLIYGGRLTSGDLVGEPDLLELRGNGYIPGDIKSGSGFEGDESDGKLKEHYAVQLAHYVLILEQLDFGDGTHEAFVIDRAGDRVPYCLDDSKGVRTPETWWDIYQQALAEVREIVQQTQQTLGALSSVCKLCHWYSHCKAVLIANDDLTLVAELGRTKRDVMMHDVPNVATLAVSDPTAFFNGKKTIFSGIGQDSLSKFHARAQLLSTPGASAYLTGVVNLPIATKEVYFDIEADPMRDIVYLHGFVERLHGDATTARFNPFFADGIEPLEEEAVFRKAWEYLVLRVQDSTIYYYSKYERTAYRKLAEKYPTVCSVDEVNALFALPAMIDLYFDVVKKHTEWPTYDQSIKTLAQHLGFQWRDSNPSGAASIEWYHQWIESNDPAIKQRILDYNEDDCLATGIVVDGIKQL